MSIEALSKKLRHAADVLDELLELEGTPEIAIQIKKTLKKKKLHWTQRPENKEKVRLMTVKRSKMRNSA